MCTSGSAKRRRASRIRVRIGSVVHVQTPPAHKHKLLYDKHLVVFSVTQPESDAHATVKFLVCETGSAADTVSELVSADSTEYVPPPSMITYSLTMNQLRHVFDPAILDPTTVRDDAEVALPSLVAQAAPSPPDAQWYTNRQWHKVIISHTMRPTKKAHTAPLNPDAQATMINALVRSIPNALRKLRKSATRPPGDPNMYLVWHLCMAEKGTIKGASHAQEVLIVMSAYPVAQCSAMDVALARRARGETRRQRERTLRMHQEEATVTALKKHYFKEYQFDRSRASLNSVIRVCELATEDRMKTYPAKDYGEDHAVYSSLHISGFDEERELTADEMLQLSTEAHTYAASERNAYKKVLQPKHVYLTDSNAEMRVSEYFAKNHWTHLMPSLETGIKNMLIEKVAKLDLKALPKLHTMHITDSLRRNLLLMIDADPTLLSDDPDIISEVWSGDREAVTKLQDATLEYRRRRHLPALAVLHKATPQQMREAVRTGTLNGTSVPVRMRPFNGRILIVDFAMTGGTASDIQRIAAEEHYEVRKKVSTHHLSVERASWGAAQVAEELMRSGLEFFTFSESSFEDIRNHAVEHVLQRVDEAFAKDTNMPVDPTDPNDVPAYIPHHLLHAFIDSIDDASPAATFVGVLTHGEWHDAFVDTTTHADDGDQLTVHIAVVYNPVNMHAFTVAWQMSKTRNDGLLEMEVAHLVEEEDIDLHDTNAYEDDTQTNDDPVAVDDGDEVGDECE